ncbi:MAG TPA: condensation domain-containing protein, partial [Blastocatellia bacterium]
HNERLITEAFGTDQSIHVVGWLPLFHDMGLIGNVLQPLYLGASCTLFSPLAFLQRPRRWLEAISHFRGTVSGGPNFAYDLCVRKIKPQDRERLDLSSWAIAFNGSEPIRKETLDRFVSAFAPHGFRETSFYPCYGLAEATLFVSGVDRNAPPSYKVVDSNALSHNVVSDASPEDHAARTVVSIGFGGSDQRVVIVDPETMLPCEPRAVGEVWVSGPSIAGGYWGRTDESERTFAAALADGSEGSFLRTGDLGFMLDGELYITGRLKDMIIIRGRNLYPQDIEFTVQQAHPAIREGGCAAFALHIEGEERLAIVAEADLRNTDNNPDTILEAIRRTVAEGHEAHVHTIALLQPKSIPKTSSGKIQRHACREGLLSSNLKVLVTSVAEGLEESELENAASQEWEAEDLTLCAELELGDAAARRQLIERLVRRQLGRYLRLKPEAMNLATAPAGLGVDSLMALEIQAGFEKSLGLRLPDGFMWQHPTLELLIERLLLAWEAARSGVRTAPIEAGPLDGELPVSSGQERLWFLDRLSPGSPVYNLHFGLRISGPLDVEVLRRSLDELVIRHAILRTVFKEVDGRPRQIIQPSASINLIPVDLSAWQPDQQGIDLDEIANEIASEPYDLATGPLARWHLASLSETDHVLFITQHHIITDGWSIALLGTELISIYQALVKGETPPAPPSLQFADYARWESSGAARLQSSVDYWMKQLDRLPRLDVPADRSRPPRRSHRGGRIDLRVPTGVSERLVALGRSEGCTPFVTLLTGFAVLLHRYTDQEDFAIGSFIANRGRIELRQMVGFLANTIVLRCDLSGEPSFRDLMRRCNALVAEAMLHSSLPFGDVVQVAGETR